MITSQILSGIPIRDDIKQQLKERVSVYTQKPKLVIIHVGSRPDSAVYIKQKKQFGEDIGVSVHIIDFPADSSEEQIKECVDACNNDISVTGIIIQLPLPDHISTEVINRIDPQKDVDGLSYIQQAKLYRGDTHALIPATARGILTLCQHYGVLETGKHVLVVGRSFLVGKPLACLFLAWDMTVTIAHSKSKQIKELSRQADIVVVAVGVAHLVDESWFDGLHKPVVIDVGIHRTEQGLCGGVYTDRIKHLVSAYTPVPGGVGPLTVASLFQNLCDAYEYSQDSGGVVQ